MRTNGVVIAAGLLLTGVALRVWVKPTPAPSDFPRAAAEEEAFPSSSGPSSPQLSADPGSPSGSPAVVSGLTMKKAIEVASRIDVARFRRLEECLDPRGPCVIPETEPRSRQLWFVERARFELGGIRRDYNGLTADQKSALREPLAEVTRWALRFPDDDLKEEGLALARVSLDEPERTSLVIESLQDSVSAPLFRQGLAILKESGPSSQRDDFLAATLAHGGEDAALEVARDLLPFLNNQNVDRFRDVQAMLDPSSSLALTLDSNLQEFDLLAGGG